MYDFKGTVLEIGGKKAIVMTNLCDFVTVKRQPQMYVGQQITFSKKDLYNSAGNHLRYIALVASILIAFFSYFIYYQFFIPSTVFAYIDVDINPSIEFAIDTNSRVVEVKPLNSDAQVLLDSMKLKRMPVKQAIAEVVKRSEQQGYIKPGIENAVLLSASRKADETVDSGESEDKLLDDILSELGSSQLESGEADIKLEVLKVSSEERNQAVKNEISMGRYELYNKIKDEDTNITVQQAKSTRVSDMLEKAKSNASDKDNAGKKDGNDNKVNNKEDNKKEKNNSNNENAENIRDSSSSSTDDNQAKDKKDKKKSLTSDDLQTDIKGADVDNENPVASISDSDDKYAEDDSEKKQKNKDNETSPGKKKDDESKKGDSKDLKEKKDIKGNSNKNN